MRVAVTIISAILATLLVVAFGTASVSILSHGGSGRSSPTDIGREFRIALALGDVYSGSRAWSIVNKFGQNPDVDTAADEDIWDCPQLNALNEYPFLPSASTLYVSSDSDSDAAATTITVVGLDANWDPQMESVVLGSDAGTGTTSVQVGGASDWIRVTSVRNTGAAITVGNVYVHDGVDAGGDGIPDTLGDIRGCFLKEIQRSKMAIVSVPRNHVGLFRMWHYGLTPAKTGANKELDLRVRVREFGGIFQVRGTRGLMATGTSAMVEAMEFGPPIAAKSDLVIRAENANVNDINVFSAFDVIIVPR